MTKDTIARAYPHRVAMDPDTCPVCCGDSRTTDPKFGGKVLYEAMPGAPVRECLACPIWHGND